MKKRSNKYIDPKGFVNDYDPDNYEEVKIEDVQAKPEEPIPEKIPKQDFRYPHNFKHKEYGFKVKAPEPTRHGDWEIGGRCTDF